MKILVAVDGSEISSRAVKHVIALARAMAKPPKILVAAVDLPMLERVAVAIGAKAAAELHAENTDHMLRPARRMLGRAKLPFEELGRVGEIAPTILKLARSEMADLIVIGSHGHGAVQGMLLGSISAKVLSQADRPVTIVR
jgi:nucleotide-binding universal stress UspA family protein